jgi:uncharacterized circularly permuted ATP-grasp superfamily protein
MALHTRHDSESRDPRVAFLANRLIDDGYFDDHLAARRAAIRLVEEIDLMAAEEGARVDATEVDEH